MVHLHQEIQYSQNEGIAEGFYIVFSLSYLFIYFSLVAESFNRREDHVRPSFREY